MQGDLLLLAAGPAATVNKALDAVRQYLAEQLGEIDASKHALLWVTDFPLFEYNADEQRLESMHHPFTAPDLASLPEGAPLFDANALAYDLVYNGYEIGALDTSSLAVRHPPSPRAGRVAIATAHLQGRGTCCIMGKSDASTADCSPTTTAAHYQHHPGFTTTAACSKSHLPFRPAAGGSLRIHKKDLQLKVFEAIGLTPELAQQKFGFLLNALDLGAPPHGGIAFGLDRTQAIAAAACSPQTITLKLQDTVACMQRVKARCVCIWHTAVLKHDYCSWPRTAAAADLNVQPSTCWGSCHHDTLARVLASPWGLYLPATSLCCLVCRLVMLMAGASSIRDVIAFPKTTQLARISRAHSTASHDTSGTAAPNLHSVQDWPANTNCLLALCICTGVFPGIQRDAAGFAKGQCLLQGQCLVVDAPAPVQDSQLRELHIQTVGKTRPVESDVVTSMLVSPDNTAQH
ncbi:hypothetical protein MMC29_001312 [Sticta canariensis]|nr:hypothetical protein [Sticta canariensis]